MSRYNMFNQIHKGLRILLYDTAALLGRTDFDNPGQYEEAASRVREVVLAFDNHAHHEDNSVLPMINEYEPAVVTVFEQEHIADHALGRRIQESLMALDLAISPVAKMQLGIVLTGVFIDFMVFNLQHMAKEETVLNKFLWRYYSDEELLETNKKIVAAIPPAQISFTSKWMMKGLSDTEIINWLRNVERSAPPQVYRPLFVTAEKELEQTRFRRVLEALTEGVMRAS